MGKRIIGLDVARALAVFGMIIVNFKIVLGENGNPFLRELAQVLDGKAAATFVVLAGVGLAMMSGSALNINDPERLKRIRLRIFRRAVFLFGIGLTYIAIWPADILHFYGIYMLFTLLLLNSKRRTILLSALVLAIIYPVLMVFFEYESNWNFTTLEYQNFWSPDGFLKNLFYNGFHPVIPWTSFMLVGLWFGRKNIRDMKFIKKAVLISLSVFIGTKLISSLLINLLAGGDPGLKTELTEIMGTGPMPPLPIYMVSGSSLAIFVISGCILLAHKYERNKIIDALYKTGQMALTFYVAHVIIGMGLVESIEPQKMGQYSIEFSFLYALLFSLLCILTAVLWRKYKTTGPLEWAMRKLTG